MADIPADRPKGRSLRPLSALAPFLAPHWRVLAAALTALLVAAVAQLALPIAFRYLIDEGLAVRDAETINRYFIFFLVAAVVFGVFAALSASISSRGSASASSRTCATPCTRTSMRMDPDVLRGHSHGRGAVAAHGGHDARAVDLRRRHLDHTAFGADAARLARDARGHEPEVDDDDRRC